MIKKYISLLIILTMLATPILPAFAATDAADAPTTVYVAPYGNDNNPGTIDKPLGTLKGAVELVRASKNTDAPITEVIFRGGNYYRTDNVEMTAADSGTVEKPIVYRAYEGETPRFLGSAPVDMSLATQVTDAATLARLHEDAIGKLVKVDLAAQGFTKDDICDYSKETYFEYSLQYNDNYNAIYIDGYEQDLAQWPNGRGNFTTWAKSVNNYCIQYREENPSRWVNAKNWWVGAYPNYDYAYTTTTPVALDPVAKTITLSSKSYVTFTNPYSKRWKVFNLLEELDVPGEFYIDRDTMTLYLYPPHTLKDAKVTLSVVKPYLLNITNTQHVTFEGLTFSETRHCAVRTCDVRNIDFISCTFNNIGNGGLTMAGTKTVQTVDKIGVDRGCKVDAAYDMDVRGCVFDHLGYSALVIQGGNIDTLTPSNNIIEDNYFSRTNLRYWQTNGVHVFGCGNVVRNNVFSNTRQQCIYIMGNDNIIERNELYDCIREVGDAAAIYQGRTHLYRGSHIRQNLIHSIWPADPHITAGNIALYQDDGQTGNFLYENIIVDAKRAYNSNYAGEIEFKNNTIVDCPSRWAFHDNPITEGDNPDRTNYGTIAETINNIVDKELFFKHYPGLKEWSETHRNPKTKNRIEGNLIVGESTEKVGTQDRKYTNFIDNVLVAETNDFVDPENLDYRVKSGSELKKKAPGVLDDTFDINLIGMKNPLKFNGETSAFRLLSPKSGTLISADDVKLRWQEPIGANEFRVVVAKDKEFKNVVYDEVVRYAYANIGNLDRGETYFWKVSAMNTSRQSKNTWEHDGAAFSFTTRMYDPLNLKALDDVLMVAEDEMASNIEGATSGTFKQGAAENLRNYIDVTKTLTNLPFGRYTQRSLDARLNYIRNYYGNKDLVNKGYVDLSQYMLPGMWSNNPVIENGTVYVLCPPKASKDAIDALITGVGVTAPFAGSSIYCFDATFNPGPAKEWISFGISKSTGDHQYNKQNNGYYVIVKMDCIELQRNDGSGPKVIEVKNGVTLLDGKKHSIRFGVINTHLGCNIVMVVDGETWFSYADISQVAQTTGALSFVAGIRTEGTTALFEKSAEIPTAENFDKLVVNMEYNSAKAAAMQIKNALPGITGVRLFKAGTTKAITEDGVFDISYAPTEIKDNSPMVPASLVARLFGTGDVIDGEKAVLSIRENALVFTNGDGSYTVNGEKKSANVAPYMKNGHLMISLQDIADALGIQLMVDIFNDVILLTDTGSVNSANEAQQLKDAAAMLEKLSQFETTQDVLYRDLKFN